MIVKRHSGIFAFENQASDGDPNEDDIVIPENIEEMPDEELDALETRAVEAFDALYDTEPSDAESVTTLADLAEGIETLRAERERREAVRAEAQANAAALRERVHAPEPEPEEEESPVEAEAPPTPEAEAPAPPPTAEALPVAATTADTVTAATTPAAPRRTRRINVPLSEIRARAPEPEAPESRLVITAAADVPRYAAGHPFASLTELGEALRERAKSTPISASGLVQGPKVATIRTEYKHKLGADMPMEQVNRTIKELTNPESLVAGGGWCAPSETSYSFFDITCEDGMVDLPTFGVTRGGIRYPVSPSLASVWTGSFDVTTNPWLWTEDDDIATVTGTPNKPCVRVPCPSFTDVRLECYGLCLTAGNLTDNAFPEATENQIGLLRSAHYHAMNQRYLAAMVALSTSPAVTGFGCDAISSDLLTTAEWAAIDYRTRYGMCENDVLEMVLPFWAKAVVRADMAYRTGSGTDTMSITDQQINDWFDRRGVRVQWVKDWQVRGANQPGGATPSTAFPTNVDFLIYAAGTFGLGNGMTLDLGVVRDSTLNAENDHTALWTEECHLVALLGHESRRYSVCVCASGKTGEASIDNCHNVAAPIVG